MDTAPMLGKRIAACFFSTAALAATAAAQASVQGRWSAPYPQTPFLGHTEAQFEVPFIDQGNTGYLVHSEIGHACLIPARTHTGSPGPHAGKVLIWDRQEFVSFADPLHPLVYAVTRKVFILDPTQTPPSIQVVDVPDGQIPTSIFCYGTQWLPNGLLLLAGADITAPVSNTYIFDPDSTTFYPGPSSHRARFYPTLTYMPSGRVAMIGGRDETQFPVPKFDEWEMLRTRGFDISNLGTFVPQLTDQTWTPLGTPLTYPFDYYPRTFTINDPQGKDRLFIAHDVVKVEELGVPPPVKATYTYRDSDQRLRIHDANLSADPAPADDRRYGSAVMLCQIRPSDPASPMAERVFAMCGSNQVLSPEPLAGYPALNTYDEFTNLETGQWTRHLPAGPLVPEKRIWQNALPLPDGGIFVIGGSRVDSEFPTLKNCPNGQLSPPPCPYYADPVMFPEIFYAPDASGPGSPLRLVKGPQQAVHRLYHGIAILLPDARVLCLGSSDRQGSESPVAPGTESALWPGNTAEIYSPAYKYQGVDGRILDAPATTTVGGAPFHVEVQLSTGPAFPQETFVNQPDARVALIKCGTVTHHQDYDTRLVELAVTGAAALGGGRFRLVVAPPSTANRGACPPGNYMMFVRTPQSKVPLGSGFLQVL